MRRFPFLLATLLVASSPALAQFSEPPTQTFRGGPNLPSGFYLEDAIDEDFTLPVAVAFAPGGRMFVVEKRGIVWTVQNGVLQEEPFLDIQDEVLNSHDRGLLGIAVDRDFATNRRVFLSYTVDHEATTDVRRTDAYARVTSYAGYADNPGVADPSTRNILIGETFATGIASCFYSHTIGTLAMGTDGTLIVGTGDGASYRDPDPGGLYPNCFGSGRLPASEDIGSFRSQRLESLAGKLLRIDPETGRGLPSNPFYTGNANDNASKVWALGLRNPYRFTLAEDGSTDPSAGRPGTLYVGDVGWRWWEEMNVSRGGENFGWPCYEGEPVHPEYQALSPATNGCDTTPAGTLTDGAFIWHHSDASRSTPPGRIGRAVVGGAIYSGDRYPNAYRGRLFYGDYSRGWTGSAPLNGSGTPTSDDLFSGDTGPIVGYTYDSSSRYLYMVNVWTGRVQRLRHTGEAPNAAPVARVSASPESGGAGLQVQLSPEGSFDPDGDPLVYSWDLGDGRQSDARAPLVTYDSPGTYTVELTLSDGVLLTTATKTIRVRAGGAPSIAITPETRSARPRAGETITLRAAPSDPDQSAASLSVQWTVTQVHDNHVHPNVFTADGPEASFTPVAHGSAGELYYYRITAEVRDNTGLADRDEFALFLTPGFRERDVTADATPISRASLANIGRLVDGAFPSPGAGGTGQQVRTRRTSGQEWIGLEFDSPQRFTRLFFVEGRHEAEGGWWETLGVQVRQSGSWTNVVDLAVSPIYRANDGENYNAYTLSFAAKQGDAIRIRGRAGGTGGYVTAAELRAYGVVEPFGPLPDEWASRDVGPVSASGQSGWEDGTFSVIGSGDVWGAQDRFHFVHRPLPPGGEIVTRVASLSGEADWSKAGLVVRESLEPGARYVGLLVSGLGTHLQIRRERNADTDGPTDRWNETTPRWLRLKRTGGDVIASVSADGATWLDVDRITLDLGAGAVAGLAVSSADYGAGALAQGTFDNVSVELGVSDGWESQDVGSPLAAGSLSREGSALVIQGGGDVWGSRDNFHFAHQPLVGDGSVIAHVASLDGSADWIKAGLAVRTGLEAGAPYVGVFASGLGVHFQYRTGPDGATAGPTDLWGVTAPVWLRLDRSGTTVSAFQSADGVSWSAVATVDVPALSVPLTGGLAVSAADFSEGRLATARFEDAAVYTLTSRPANNAEAKAPIGFGIDRVYPNPARDRITVLATAADAGDLTIEVLDALGRRIAHHRLAAASGVVDATLSLRGVPSGAYVVRVTDEATGERVTERVTVVR